VRRREVLGLLGAAPLTARAVRSPAGVCVTSYMTAKKPRDAFWMLEHCAELGASGVQTPLFGLDAAGRQRFRARCEELGLYYEGMVSMPGEDSSVFERSLVEAKEAGATVVRAGCLSGRRYETFSTLADWKQFVAKSRASIAQAVPLLAKHKMAMGLENHKDWTLEEHLALMKEFGGDYFGCCLDTGNNIALLDHPQQYVEALAPYAITTHIKEMAWEESNDGFLLSEVVFDEGMTNFREMMRVIRKAKPQVRMVLEMITRDPLSVPCLSPKYWATFPDRPGDRLAATMRLVREARGKRPLPRYTASTILECEEKNIQRCLAWIAANA
jgi:3-oxoisoapionate decarboxylase